MEKIINEFRVIETDDGYRIEIKGDKEAMKAFMGGSGPWHRGHRRGWKGGPFGFHFGPMMWAKMACCWEPWETEHEPDVKPEAD